MSQYELPPTPTKSMNENELARMLKDAFVNVLPFVYQSTPLQKPYIIWQPTENGAASYLVSLPNPVSIWEPFSEALQAGVLNELATYLWEHGVPRVPFTGPADRQAWTRVAIKSVFRPAVVQWLEDMFIRNACSGQYPPTWPIPTDEMLDEFASRQARLINNDEILVTAYYFIPAFEIPPGEDPLPLGLDITLRNPPQSERHILLSQSASFLLWDDMFSLTPNDTLCEIKMYVHRSDIGVIMDIITEKLNILKLALTLVQHDQWKNGEGIVLVSTQSGDNYRGTSRMLRRRSTQWARFQASDEVVEQLRRNIVDLQQGIEDSPDLKNALWLFGRACTADLPRDQLVEAVVGMESLLVPKAGESTYRFGLHGTAILCTSKDDAADLAKQLKRLYALRSKGVHGAGKGSTTEVDADNAVVKFAHVISRIVMLRSTGKLPNAESIAQSVERLVLIRAAGRQ